MTSDSHPCTLAAVLAELGEGAQLSRDDLALSTRPVSGSSVWSGHALPESAPDVALVCPPAVGAEALTDLFSKLPASPSRILVLTTPPHVPSSEVAALAGEHAVVIVGQSTDQADVVLAVGRATHTPDDAIARRLSSLQRSLTMALSSSEPIPALLAKLKSVCNATVALVDKRGAIVHATGPLPMRLILDEIGSTPAASQAMQVEGWFGLADRVADQRQDGESFGWLVAAARRPEFPDGYASAAIHVATTLVEASLRLAQAALRQEQAIRSAVLEEAIALDRLPRAPELAGRLASLGLSFNDDLRVVVCHTISGRRRAAVRDEAGEALTRLLERENIAHLVSTRDSGVALLVQCTPATLRRLLVAGGSGVPEMRVGIGRSVTQIAHVASSFNDAQLAVRSLRAKNSGVPVMGYDEFDFATRLFADVGLDSMLDWAARFLAPLDREGPLFESLQVYFERNQNINAAAKDLHVHHNSLRYRLAKVEELLNISLRDPAAVSSVHLALAAVDLGHRQTLHSSAPDGQDSKPADIEAPAPEDPFGRPGPHRGVVLPPHEG